MDSSERRPRASRRARRHAAAWLVLSVLLAPLLLGGCSRLLSIVDPTAF